MRSVDVFIIGGGPAGLAAAIAAREQGVENLLLVEREPVPGGNLKQCAHRGFGGPTFGEELTGPEYVRRYIDRVAELDIPCQYGTMVLDISPDRTVTAVSAQRGLEQIRAGAIVLAMGCRERPRGALGIPGWRCAGIWTAGTAQKFVNWRGLMPGRNAVILGSGDIGLIMARRMSLEGCTVKACVEIMPYSSGLPRNLEQCLNAFKIPLLLSHTVTDIAGRERLEGVTIAQVGPDRLPIPGTEREISCDTLLLSVGLIPENELSKAAGIEIAGATAGPVVDEMLETNLPGVFAAGNVLHVHDLVDCVSEEAGRAGVQAARYALSRSPAPHGPSIPVQSGFGVNGAVPQRLHIRDVQAPVHFLFRPAGVYQNACICLDLDAQEVFRSEPRDLSPGGMAALDVPPAIFAAHPDARSAVLRLDVPVRA